MRTRPASLMIILAVVLGITAFTTGCEQMEAEPEGPRHPAGL